MLASGDPAPAVTARNHHGESVTPDFEGPTVVYFYPKDFTGGCTIEANDFQDALPEFREVGIAVYGVSMDDAESHPEFAREEGLEFDLLADPDGEVAAAFGLDTDEGYTDRRTFVLTDGEVGAVYDPELADPSGHAREVLDDTRTEFVSGA
ncbi:peroxiredoxin [Halobacteriales archaeon QS_6_71_20]|nr:MAG: peroxiredoxin [Halobacteriales archaeon QS_6_71_20]